MDPFSAYFFLQGAGGLGQAYAAYEGAKANRVVAKANARLADYQAQDALSRGAREQARYRTQGDRLIGRQKASLAAGNVQLQGSALDILDDTAKLIDEDVATIRENSEREALGFRTQASGYRAQARGSSPGMAAATSLLTSGTRVASDWYGYALRYGGGGGGATNTDGGFSGIDYPDRR